MGLRVRLAKAIMKAFPNAPVDPRDAPSGFREVFDHPMYLDADADRQAEIRRSVSQTAFDDELDYPWDIYYGDRDLRPQLRGADVLDLGSFCGGRGMAWFERYQLKSIAGIDIEPVFKVAAAEFAKHKGVDARYECGVGEHLPFEDASFDAILSFDVLEHVQDVAQTMSECHRVLRKDGRLFLVFPSYWQPQEHHLGLATSALGIQYLFSGQTLVRAFNEIVHERGPSANWYQRHDPQLAPWERGHAINGTSWRAFKRLLGDDWAVEYQCRLPIGAIGRSWQDKPIRRLAASPMYLLARLPLLEEIAMHRITVVLKRR